MAVFVPITIETGHGVDAILIYDDPLIHVSWELSAKKNSKKLILFSTAEEFIRAASAFSKNVFVYVDVNLANGVRGEDVAKKLSLLGFYNIYLATGFDPVNFTNIPFIKGVVDKHSPF